MICILDSTGGGPEVDRSKQVNPAKKSTSKSIFGESNRIKVS
jgi:hypothetical protein